MPTPIISIVLFLIASLLGALGQYLYKSGADSAAGSIASYLINPRLRDFVGTLERYVLAAKDAGIGAAERPLQRGAPLVT